MDEKEERAAKQHAGFEVVYAYNWGVSKVSTDTVLLNISHPRFGPLSYVLPALGVASLVTALQGALAQQASTQTPQQVPPTSH